MPSPAARAFARPSMDSRVPYLESAVDCGRQSTYLQLSVSVIAAQVRRMVAELLPLGTSPNKVTNSLEAEKCLNLSLYVLHFGRIYPI
jgi:hypothetical protein